MWNRHLAGPLPLLVAAGASTFTSINSRAARSSAAVRDIGPDPAIVLRQALLADGRIRYEARQTVVISNAESSEATVTREICLGNGVTRTEYLLPSSAAGRVVAEDGHSRWEYDPQHKLVVRTPYAKSLQTPEEADRTIARIRKSYRIKAEPQSSPVAGRPSFLLEFTPIASDRNRHLWWVQKGSGFIVRRETYGPDGRLLWTSSYSALNFAPGVSPASIAFVAPAGARVVTRKPRPVYTAQEAAKQSLSGLPAPPKTLGKGFQLDGARRVTIRGVPAIQYEYSDGIVGISYLRIRGVSRTSDKDSSGRTVNIGTKRGVLYRESRFNLLSWSSAAASNSLIGDVPASMLAAIAGTLP